MPYQNIPVIDNGGRQIVSVGGFVRPKVSLAAIIVDANATFTWTAGTSLWTQYLTAPITAGRTVTLAGGTQGDTGTFVRAAGATGAFNWSIGGLKNLTAGQWCDIMYDGGAWFLLRFGSL